MATIKRIYELRGVEAYTAHHLNNPTGYTISSKEKIGIEVEVENVEAHGRLNPVWEAKGDGSLRNNGMEFVTQPVLAQDAPAIIHHLMVDVLGQQCCFSPRTSVHVHLDMQDNENDTVLDMMLLYAVYERLFYRFVGKARIRNIYCVPITETRVLTTAAISGLKPSNWSKYTGLNIRPLSSFGTVEFRHMHGTPDVQKLCVWIDLITRLKEYCVNNKTATIRKTVAEMHDEFDFAGHLTTIFGDITHHLKYESVGDVYETYQIAKQLLTRPAETLRNMQRNLSDRSPYFCVKGF